MVDLKKISPAELYEALERKDDGKTFVELVKAKAKLQETVLSAQEKAGQKILDYIKGEFTEIARDYKEEWGERWFEAIKRDCAWELDHTPTLDKLLFEYLNLIVE